MFSPERLEREVMDLMTEINMIGGYDVKGRVTSAREEGGRLRIVVVYEHIPYPPPDVYVQFEHYVREEMTRQVSDWTELPVEVVFLPAEHGLSGG